MLSKYISLPTLFHKHFYILLLTLHQLSYYFFNATLFFFSFPWFYFFWPATFTLATFIIPDHYTSACYTTACLLGSIFHLFKLLLLCGSLLFSPSFLICTWLSTKLQPATWFFSNFLLLQLLVFRHLLLFNARYFLIPVYFMSIC